MSTRQSLRKKDFLRKPEDFDNSLNQAIQNIKERCPKDWDMILGYIASLALLHPIGPENVETVAATYHQKVAFTQIVKRFQGLEEVKGAE